jgi:predicted porin
MHATTTAASATTTAAAPRRALRRAAAALLAAAGATAALAQSTGAPAGIPPSSVQIYGVLDVAVERLNHVGAASGNLTRMPSITGTLPSRIGFRGSEDLGDGLRAVFNLETGFAPDQGTLGQGGRLFGRQAYVGLSDSRWGTLTAGRQYSMLFWSVLDSDVMGPTLYAPGSLDAYIPNARHDNALSWRNTIAGLSLGATYSFGRDTVNAGPSPVGTNCPGESATDRNACRAWSAMAKYDTPLWGASLAYDRQNGRTLASATDVIFGNLNSSGKNDTRLALGGYVKLGIGAKIGGGVIRRDNDGDAAKPRSDLWYLGASYPITPLLALDAQYSTLRYKNANDTDADLVALRLVYSLSKRTAVYTQAGHIRNDRLSAVSVSGGQANGNPAAGRSQSGLAVGVRHTF